jgi:hypothetical protein
MDEETSGLLDEGEGRVDPARGPGWCGGGTCSKTDGGSVSGAVTSSSLSISTRGRLKASLGKGGPSEGVWERRKVSREWPVASMESSEQRTLEIETERTAPSAAAAGNASPPSPASAEPRGSGRSLETETETQTEPEAELGCGNRRRRDTAGSG